MKIVIRKYISLEKKPNSAYAFLYIAMLMDESDGIFRYTNYYSVHNLNPDIKSSCLSSSLSALSFISFLSFFN